MGGALQLNTTGYCLLYFKVKFPMSVTLSLCSNKVEVAAGMRQWHKALGQVRSSAQLSLCIQHLQKSIVWKRDVIKVVGFP